MPAPPVSFDAEELLAHMGWVRALALRVASDAHVAEDLTQDTMLVALRESESGRPRPASLRRWLAVVVRNLGRASRRGEQRRSKRESEAANPGLSPSTLAMIERAATQRELVGALLELKEPYRSTLLMRFFEERSQREIAERTGVPVSTVGTRIAEGLKRLRRKFGGRQSWLSSIFALFHRPQDLVLSAPASGAVLMSVQTKSIIGAVVLAGTLIAFRALVPSSPAVAEFQADIERPRSELASVEPPVEASRERVEAPAEEERVELTDGRPPGFYDIPEHAGLVSTTAEVRGRVIDIAGRPVGGIEVCRYRPRGTMEGTNAPVPAQLQGCETTDSSGRFETEGLLPFVLNVRDDHYTTLLEAYAVGAADEELTVVVAHRIPLGGVVIDEFATPIKNALVTVQASILLPESDLGSSTLIIPEVRTDDFGVFAIKDAAEVEESVMQFQAPGFATQITPLPRGGNGAMTVVLSREIESLYSITGHVVRGDGSPAPGAMVSTGVLASPTDEQGFFVINFEPWLEYRVDEDEPTVVTAISPGLLPASLTLPSVNEARASGWPREVVLELDDEPLTIRGIVVDEEGKPLSRLSVEPADMSEFGLIPLEGAPALSGVPKTLEEIAGGGETHTDEDGNFELKGLLDRKYSVRVLRKPSLLCTTSGPIAAGDHNVRIVLDHGVLGTIEGRIVDRHGKGLAGLRIAVSRRRPAELVIGTSAVTDQEGKFKLTDVTTEPEYLRIEGDAIVPELFRELGEEDDVSDLELVVERRCRIQFDWGSWPGREDELFVVDGSGERLMMMKIGAGRIGEVPSVTFQETVIGNLVVSDAAAHAVVYRDGVEVTRIPLDLEADEPNLIQL